MESLTASRQKAVVGDLDEAVALRANYVLFIVLSCVIATFGLILNSGAVIIGAMLISPLMSPILAFALAVVVGDPRRAGRALASLLLGGALAIGLSAALGLLIAGSDQNFLAQLPAEVLSRTQPTLFDLAVALAGGAAAAYALAEPKLSATLAGVAIATALMPPLCVVGLGIALQETTVWQGALLLFLANFVAITFAGAIVFAVRGFAPTVLVRRHLVLGRAVLISAPLLLLLAVPLTLFTARIVRNAQQNAIIRNTLVGGLAVFGGDTLVSFEQQPQQHQLLITATVRAADSLRFAAAKRMENDLAARLQTPVALTLLVIPMTRLDPAFPPTATPHTAVATAVRVVAPAATAFPTPTPTASPTSTSVPTARPTATPSPTATVAPTRAPVATPTMLPTATPLAYAVVGGTMREGVNVHRAPGLTPILTALPDGTVVEVTDHTATAGGYAWVEVIVPDGTVGWIAQRYLASYQPYHAPQ